MEEAYKEGWLRAIGVSNFYPDRLVDLCSFVEIKPAVNQVETHIFQQQKTAREYMKNAVYSTNLGIRSLEEERISLRILFCVKLAKTI